MNENIFDKRRLKTFSNCIDLVKSMVGTREGLIAYNQRFRIDLENTCYKASMYNELQQRIEKAIELNKQIKSFVYNEMVDRYVPGSTELYELVNEELKVLGGENNR